MKQQGHWVPQRAPAPRPRRIESPWGENPAWMADRVGSMVGDLGMEGMELGDLLVELRGVEGEGASRPGSAAAPST